MTLERSAEILTRRRAMAVMAVGGMAPLGMAAWLARADEPVRRPPGSTYGLALGHPIDELVGDLEHTDRGDPRRQSDTPHHDWYSQHVERRFGAWGPRARTYAPLAGAQQKPISWLRERAIATAARFIGYGYQHHHIPDWDPPASWPWKQTCVGHNGRGFDCSNFTGFVHNQGFGIRFSSAVHRQAAERTATSGGESLRLERIELEGENYERRKAVLCTGDLVYIRGREAGPVTHVVIWIGAVGRSPSGEPLVMDSHGSGVQDDQGRAIPCGVQLRPFREHSWYNRCASHAHRVFA